MLNTGVFKPTILKPMMLKPLLLVTILAWLPLTPMANAESIELLPSISLQIGEQDRRGNYWDGYDWRDRQWWLNHQGRNLGERNRNGHYWDGRRWQDRGWWKKIITTVKAVTGNTTSMAISMVKNITTRKGEVIVMMTK